MSKIQGTSDQPDDISYRLRHLSYCVIPLLSFFFTLFLIAQLLVLRQLRSLDLWCFMPLGYLTCLGSSVCGLAFVKYGGAGRHVAVFIPHQLDILDNNLKIKMVQEYIAGPAIMFPKFSIIGLYIKVFPDKWIRRTSWALGVVEGLGVFTYIIVVSLECTPFTAAWEFMRFTRHCHNPMLKYEMFGVLNVGIDIVVLLLPIPALYKLRLSPTKKLGIIYTFLSAASGGILAIVKLWWFFKADLMEDLTYHGARIEEWTIAESALYFCCTCYPSVRVLILHLLRDGRFSHSLSRLRPATWTARSKSVSYSSSVTPKSNTFRRSNVEPTQLAPGSRESDYQLSLVRTSDKPGLNVSEEHEFAQDSPSELEAGSVAKAKPQSFCK